MGPDWATGSIDVVIEVAHYGVPTFCEALGPAFCCAELEVAGRTVAWTAAQCIGFSAEARPEYVQRIERYSYQRAFCEGFRPGCGGQAWLRAGYRPIEESPLQELAQPPRWLRRDTPAPSFALAYPKTDTESGRATPGLPLGGHPTRHRFLHDVPHISAGFPLNEVEWPLFETLAGLRFVSLAAGPAAGVPAILGAHRWLRWDFGAVKTGFIHLALRVKGRARVILVFDEVLIDGHIRFDRLECINALWIELEEGDEVEFQSFEPYALRYLQALVVEGAAEISHVALRLVESPVLLRGAGLRLPPLLETVRGAALASFRQNVIDLYMDCPLDCPSRERAGWLCDSHYMARAEWHLTGDNIVERAFLENYLLPRRFDDLPEGMVAMCYPAATLERAFIPNWALSFVVQLDDARRNRTLPARWQPLIERRVRGLLRYFEKFENELGLLEKLEGWIFVEWSEANAHVQDVNFPTNMLYAAMLEAAGGLLDESTYLEKACRLRRTIRKWAWRDDRFVDNALRAPSGALEPTHHASEVCQYHAFSLGLVSPTERPELWRRLVNEDFGDLYPVNALYGKLLRMELMLENNEAAKVEGDLVRYYAPMALRTGTLWEHLDTRASCNHGFTSYLAVLIDRLPSGLGQSPSLSL